MEFTLLGFVERCGSLQFEESSDLYVTELSSLGYALSITSGSTAETLSRGTCREKGGAFWQS